MSVCGQVRIACHERRADQAISLNHHRITTVSRRTALACEHTHTRARVRHCELRGDTTVATAIALASAVARALSVLLMAVGVVDELPVQLLGLLGVELLAAPM